MTQTTTNEKTRPDKNDRIRTRSAAHSKGRHPVHVVRSGAIAASIWKRQTSAGFEYLDFSLSRSWKLKSGEREGYSQNFFESNAAAIAEVVRQASEYIRDFQADPNSTSSEHGTVPTLLPR